MSAQIHRIASQFYNRPLLLLPSAAETISAFLSTRLRAGGGKSSNDDSGESREFFRPTQSEAGAFESHSPRASRFYGSTPLDAGGRPMPFRRTADGVAIVTVVGELVNRGAWIGASSGLVSYEGLKVQVASAAQDPNTRAILLDLESPGGEAVGAFEAAAAVRAAAKSKPVVAIANGMAASAAYAIASGAGRIVASPTGMLGSIGVVGLHLDFSKYLAEEGVKPTLIFAGAHKVDGNPYEPLPDDVRAEWQQEINSFYDQFVSTVAAGRKGLSAEQIRATEARVFKGEAAVEAGLADSVGTFEEVLAELSRGSSGRSASSSQQMKGSKMDNNQGAPAAELLAGISTVAQLSTSFPALVSQIQTEAATAERSRVLGIAALADASNGALVAELQADGRVTVADAALRILNAQREAKAQQHQAIKDVEQTTAGVKPSASSSVLPATETAPAASTPDGWAAEYDAQTPAGEKLRSEFAGKDDYLAFKKNEGKVKILKK